MTEVNVCIGSACHVRGAYNVAQTFQQMIEEKSLHSEMELKTTFCVRECHNPGVAVTVGKTKYNISAESAADFFNENIATGVKRL
ncbi:MAG: (2Fe-2S) ferredoxin domain-containing protein [Synergistaceae bacterium]|jgi:NADH:ubiquinone oxidoreductase subunit E|nr:(2Fe-2S) ferredoxin domain-containing protein [Synergistaceae bacterium]